LVGVQLTEIAHATYTSQVFLSL